MNVKKGIKIYFTKVEEDAIQEMIYLASTLRDNCNNSCCDKCPLNAFCGYNQNIDDFKKSLIDFLDFLDN